MPGRTFAVGDVHGHLDHLNTLLSRLPALQPGDTLLFIGDYLDRGPDAAGVVARVRRLSETTPARVVALRGSHEDAWLKVRREGWLEFLMPVGNGCLATYRSFTGGPCPEPGTWSTREELEAMMTASFFPADVLAWMESLPVYWEDEQAIYVHAGLPREGDRWLHPSELADPRRLLWERSAAFFREYRGKRVVFGHTSTEYLPQEVSGYTPGDAKDVFVGDVLVGLDTGCGRGGFLSAIELPSLRVYESR
jgi:serine/threonine protein phosphatase 1